MIKRLLEDKNIRSSASARCILGDAGIPCFGKRNMARTGFKLNRALTMVPRDKTSRLVVAKKCPQPYLPSLACTSICSLKFFMAGVLE